MAYATAPRRQGRASRRSAVVADFEALNFECRGTRSHAALQRRRDRDGRIPRCLRSRPRRPPPVRVPCDRGCYRDTSSTTAADHLGAFCSSHLNPPRGLGGAKRMSSINHLSTLVCQAEQCRTLYSDATVHVKPQGKVSHDHTERPCILEGAQADGIKLVWHSSHHDCC